MPRVDWLGAALLSVALASFLYGLSKANAWGWGSPRVLALILGGLALGAFWVWIETKVDQPLVDMRVLRRRSVLMTNVTAVLVGFSMFASFLLIPQLAQTPERFGYGFGVSVTGAGLLMLPSTLVMLVAGPWAGRIAIRHNSRLPLVIGTGLRCARVRLLRGRARDRVGDLRRRRAARDRDRLQLRGDGEPRRGVRPARRGRRGHRDQHDHAHASAARSARSSSRAC